MCIRDRPGSLPAGGYTEQFLWCPGEGASVELRFEMDTLVLFHTCPHPLNTSPDYPRKPVRYEILDGPPATEDDANRLSAPENIRGFENNRIFHIGCCAGA